MMMVMFFICMLFHMLIYNDVDLNNVMMIWGELNDEMQLS